MDMITECIGKHIQMIFLNTEQNIVMKKEKKLKTTTLSQVQLERELWNAALRTPPPYTPKTTYTRKGKNRFNPFHRED